MNLINEMWRIYLEDNATNNMTISKIRREAFFAGARAMRDHMNTSARLEGEFCNKESGNREQGALEIVGGTEHNEDQGEFNV